MTKVYLVGVGMGTAQTRTREADEAIGRADVWIGAERVLQPLLQEQTESGMPQTEYLYEYRADVIAAYLDSHTYQTAVIVLSGDVGFYSGAKKLLQALDGYAVTLIPGISSLIYFCSRLQIPWEDVPFYSLHGRNLPYIRLICEHRRTAFLLNGAQGLQKLCENLIKFGLQEVTVMMGERLSYENERIAVGHPSNFLQMQTDHLLVVLVENPKAQRFFARTIPDASFIRGNVPMTKSTVRMVTVGKLGLHQGAVVYDIGAGTGSVSVEIAMQSADIRVYAIEKQSEGCRLITRNMHQFQTDNVTVVQGTAPEACKDLPAPTHAFIGGSSGNLRDILQAVYVKNPACRVVINTVSLETLTEVMQLVKERDDCEAEVVALQAATAQPVGAYHLMKGENPVHVITLTHK